MLPRFGWARDERGQSLLEFAFASTVFFMTMFGILELGLAVARYNMVADLAQEGARWASVRGANGTTHASASDVSAFVVSRASGLGVVVTTTPSAGPAALVAGNTITVTVTSRYVPLTGFINVGTISIASASTMTVSR